MTNDASISTTADLADLADAGRAITRRWWLFLLTGILWIIYAFIVLSASVTSVWAVAVLFGVGFISGGIVEIALSSAAESWRWLHITFGVVAIIAGICALVWPGQTFLILAAIVGWYLMIDGVFNVIIAFGTRDINNVWWLGLILGIVQIGIGFWAVGYVGRSVALLIIWVAAAALARGIGDLIVGFSLHGADRKLRRVIERPTAPAAA
jgi:uncharacterized membrane protein HdeD (DUF308 family)